MGMMKKIILIAFIILTFALIQEVPGYALTEINSPGTLDKPDEIYRLTGNVLASGTAFSINASGITLDLNGYTITYNTGSNSSSVNGVRIAAGNVEIKNGYIIQGAGKSSHSPVINISSGSGHKLHHLVIKPTGVKCYGISGRRSAEIHHVYVESHTTTSCDRGDGIAAIQLEGGSGSGDIYYNIMVNGHTGVVLIGGSQATKVYNNYIQQERRPGCKAPYGIGLSYRIHNVEVYNNQIISDNGRGIILDGWSQGASEGASGNTIHDNRIDVQYSKAASRGYYVENAVYGIRDRYSSGYNTFKDNIVLAANGVDGRLRAFYIGSDGSDSKMTGIVLTNNTVIAREFDSDIPYGAFVFFFDYAEDITATGNNYYTDGSFLRPEHHVNNLTLSGNGVIVPSSYIPGAPSGLKITRFMNSYLIEWSDNRTLYGEPQTFEYYVYRDGIKLPISPRGGTFYVDLDVGGHHTYSVSALNLYGNEGPRSASVSTDQALNGWWEQSSSGGTDNTPPSPPSDLNIQ